jgi:hypothetical protein
VTQGCPDGKRRLEALGFYVKIACTIAGDADAALVRVEQVDRDVRRWQLRARSDVDRTRKAKSRHVGVFAIVTQDTTLSRTVQRPSGHTRSFWTQRFDGTLAHGIAATAADRSHQRSR